MYIKVFESRQSARSYIIKHDLSLAGVDHGVITIENANKKQIVLGEDELYKIIDTFFKSNLK